MKNPIEINTILKEFNKITGFRISIHDAEFNEIYAYPKKLCDYCSIIQRNEANRLQCVENDKQAFQKVNESGQMVVYRCSHGLYEAVAPIYHYGILSGYFMMGQVCDSKDKYSKLLYKSAYDVLQNKAEAESTVASVKEVPEQLINSYILIMNVIAEYVTQANILPTNSGNLAELIMKYLKQNYASKITLDLLSERFYCSQSSLIKDFKKEYGTTIMSALMDVRLEKAKDMLENSRNTIKEISVKCGFTEQNYFSKAFSSKYGCSPSRYRNCFK